MRGQAIRGALPLGGPGPSVGRGATQLRERLLCIVPPWPLWGQGCPQGLGALTATGHRRRRGAWALRGEGHGLGKGGGLYIYIYIYVCVCFL